ncbi:MAG: DUF3344 domain-containing protein [Pseudomonadota bacterium]
MKLKTIARSLTGIAAGTLLLSFGAHASLTTFQTFVGNYGVSSDGWGGTDQNGTLSANIPAGATIVGAYLYSAMYSTPATQGDVTFNGTLINNWDQSVTNNIEPSYPDYFRTGREDVTSIVQAGYDGLGGTYNYSVTEHDSRIDGESLIVVYELASLDVSTVAILDGGAALGGDTTQVNFADPLDTSDPAFFAEMRLGISFSCCSQASNVTVNGSTLTNNAGSNDDGELVANGSLLTMGGDNDDLLNTNTYDGDDERYDLTPFVSNGDTSINIFTNNPSNDDNIFVALFHVKGEAGFNEPPPNVPEPAALSLMAGGLLLLGATRRRRKTA